MYFIYPKNFNIIIPRYMYTYSYTVLPNGYYLDLWSFINVLIINIFIYQTSCYPQTRNML